MRTLTGTLDGSVDATGPELHLRLVTASDRCPARPSPRLELDVSMAVERFRRVSTLLPDAQIRYAVKANPHPELLRALAAAGCGFDVASPAEASAALGSRSRPQDLIHSNPVARRDHLRLCRAHGVGRFVVDSLGEVEKLADAAPGAEVLVRIGTTGKGSHWPLSRTFGVSAKDAVPLLVAAMGLDLVPAGVAVDVGSHQRDPNAWTVPIAAAGEVFAALECFGLPLSLLDLGGVFPADHVGGVPALGAHGQTIDAALTETFGVQRPTILLEAGRAIVGDAGTLVASVIGVVHRGGRRWVHLDAGVFTGLVETLEETIRYRLETDRPGPLGPCVLAGPTCNSADVLYEKTPVQLPVDLAEGDEVRFLSAGAYTSCSSTVGFNGFEPLPTALVR